MMKYVAVTCLIAVGPVIAMESLDESSQHTLARVAAEARAQGRKTAKTSTIVELDYITAPEDHVRHISLLTGVVQKPVRRLSTRLGDLIYTWYFVGSTVWARDVPAARDVCESLPLPPQSSLNKAQEAVVGIFGGKALIDGVEVELLTNVQR